MAGDSTTTPADGAFPLTPDPAAYFPRLALESALAELTEGIGKTPACAALTGESGLGKTLLLHVLRERLEGSFECLYVPLPDLSPSALWRWAAVALGLGRGEDDRGAVLGRAVRLAAEGMGLVLLLDDAGTLPPAARSDLLAACDTTGFSLVMAFDSEDHEALATLPAHVRRVDLGPPMTLAETRAYVHARLRRMDPELATRLGAQRIAALHAASAGVPGRLHALLDAWLRSPSPPLPLEARAPAAPLPIARAAPRAREMLARLWSPRMQLAFAALFVLLIAGFWMFALQRGPGVASVGVPVERFPAPREAPAPIPPAEQTPTPAEPTPPAAPSPAPRGSAAETVAGEIAG